MDYTSKTTPFDHQAEWYTKSRDLLSFGIWWEMGTGKSKLALDTAGHLYTRGKINGLLVIAPGAVAPNWTNEEIPIHLGVPHAMHLWQSKKAATKRHAAEFEAVLKGDGLAILVLNYEAIMTKRGADAVKKFLDQRECLYVLDESARIKTPGAKRTKRILASAKYAPYRRVMTGTPVSNSPFDVFTQLKFLDPTVWDAVGCRTFEAFKTRYGVFKRFQEKPDRPVRPTGMTDTEYAELCEVYDPEGFEVVEKFDYSKRRARFTKCVEYRNLGELQQIVSRNGSRLLKTDVLDLPKKLYQKRFFELNPEQKKLYNTLRRDFMILLDEGMITAPLAIVRMIRFQQLTSGYIPVDSFDEEPTFLIADPNPRINLLREIIEETHSPFLVWAKFARDIDQIMELLADMDIPAAAFDGRTSAEDREDAKRGLKSGKYRALVLNPSCAGEGLTLVSASVVIYYNTSFKLMDRLQSEDRTHRIGQNVDVLYIDLIAHGTIDGHIVKALRQKLSYSNLVTGDTARAWI